MRKTFLFRSIYRGIRILRPEPCLTEKVQREHSNRLEQARTHHCDYGMIYKSRHSWNRAKQQGRWVTQEYVVQWFSHRFDGPSPTMVSRSAPQNVRWGGKMARGNLPGVTPTKKRPGFPKWISSRKTTDPLNESAHLALVFAKVDGYSPVVQVTVRRLEHEKPWIDRWKVLKYRRWSASLSCFRSVWSLRVDDHLSQPKIDHRSFDPLSLCLSRLATFPIAIHHRWSHFRWNCFSVFLQKAFRYGIGFFVLHFFNL